MKFLLKRGREYAANFGLHINVSETYPEYGGAADAPLLFGYHLKDFEGWQGRNDYQEYIWNLFAVNLPTKFIQHFQVMRWMDGRPVTMRDNKEIYRWVPGMKALLTDASRKHKLYIKRKSNDYNGNLQEYRNRIMCFDGKKIFEGQPGHELYLIPWYWDQNGERLEEENHKLYHYNAKGGRSNWELPAGFSGMVYIYELSAAGKINLVTREVKNGKLTIYARQATPYVVLKQEAVNQNMHWGEEMHLVDTCFNSGTLKHWKIENASYAGAIELVKSEGNKEILAVRDTKARVVLTQKLTGLKANTRYAAYVGLDNRSDANAGMEIRAGEKRYQNFSKRSIAKNLCLPIVTIHWGQNMSSTIGGVSYKRCDRWPLVIEDKWAYR